MQRIFWVIFTITLLGGASFAATGTFLSVYLAEGGVAYSIIGLIGTLAWVGGAFFELGGGVVYDKTRLGKKLIVSPLISASFLLFLLYLVEDLNVFLLVSLILGLLRSLVATLSRAVIAETTSPRRMGQTMSLYRVSGSIGLAAGNISIGVLTTLWGTEMAFLCGSLAYLAATLVLVAARFDLGPRRVAGRGSPKRLLEMEKSTLGPLLPFLIAVALVTMAASSDNQFIPVLIVERGLSKTVVGSVVALGALVEVPVMLAVGRLCDIMEERKLILLGALSFGITYPMYAVAGSEAQFLAIQSLRGVSYGLFFASCLAFAGRASAEGKVGLVQGYYGLFFSLGAAAGPYFAGLVSSVVGLSTMFVALSVIAFSSAMVALRTRSLRSIEANLSPRRMRRK